MTRIMRVCQKHVLRLATAGAHRALLTTALPNDIQVHRLQSQAVDEPAQQKIKEFSQVPGPKPLPFVGNISEVLFNPEFKTSQMHTLWEGYFKKYGPILKLHFPGAPLIIGSINPDDLETVYKSTMDNPVRDGLKSLKMIRDNAPHNYFGKKTGLLPENGAEWWRLRSRVQTPLLRPKNVAMYLSKVDRATLKFMDRIESLQGDRGQVPDDFLEELYKWALECVGLVALDKELGCLESNLPEDSTQMRMIRLVGEILVGLNETEMGSQAWRLWRTPSYRRLETAHNAFLELADECIQEAMRRQQSASDSGDRQPTVIETFVRTDGLSTSDVATMILDMLFAGVDTTAHAVAFTLYLLARNQDSQKKLQTDIDSVLGDSDELRPDHITQLPYLHYVVRESLRLYSVAPGNIRLLTEDIVMSGYKVPAGTLVIVFNMIISRDKKYFQRADEFLPERWGKDRPHGPIHRFASLPFSHGKRMCIGKRIAEQEIYDFIIRVLQRYTVSLNSSDEMTVSTQLVLKPAIPLDFTFTPRR